MTHEYQITGMTCMSCVARVKNELLKTAGILSADVQLQSPQAVITMEKHISTTVLQEAVHKAGQYSITETGGGMPERLRGEIEATEEKNSYFPIFLIFGYITGVTLIVQFLQPTFNWMQWMHHFMAGFFLVFSFFKLMKLSAFADGYATYDVVAKKWRGWGMVYPFVELALGIGFLTGGWMFEMNVIAFVVMSVSSVGVTQSLVRKTNFQCACLGTVIRLPLSKVTLFEDLLMVGMSGIGVIALFPN